MNEIKMRFLSKILLFRMGGKPQNSSSHVNEGPVAVKLWIDGLCRFMGVS